MLNWYYNSCIICNIFTLNVFFWVKHGINVMIILLYCCLVVYVGVSLLDFKHWHCNLMKSVKIEFSIAKPTRVLFQTTNLMQNSFIFQQYVCYTTLLNMFQAARCSSSGGPIVSPQPLVSSPSVSSRTVCRWRADFRSPPAYCTAVYRGWRYQRLW